jgi:transposase
VQRRKRLQVLWLVRRGRTATAAATEVGVGQRTVLRWLDWYRAGGLEAVLRRVPGPGACGASRRGKRPQPDDLTEQQRKQRAYQQAYYQRRKAARGQQPAAEEEATPTP